MLYDKTECRKLLRGVMHSMKNENPNYDVLKMHNKFGKRVTRAIWRGCLLFGIPIGTTRLFLSPSLLRLRLSILWLKFQICLLKASR